MRRRFECIFVGFLFLGVYIFELVNRFFKRLVVEGGLRLFYVRGYLRLRYVGYSLFFSGLGSF